MSQTDVQGFTVRVYTTLFVFSGTYIVIVGVAKDRSHIAAFAGRP